MLPPVFSSLEKTARPPLSPSFLVVAAALCLIASACSRQTGGGASWDTHLTNEEKVEKIQKLLLDVTPQVVEILKEATKDPAEEVRIDAIRGLGRCGRPEALPTLRQLAGSEQRSIRQTVAWALAEQKTKESLQILGPMLRDPEMPVRSQAIGSLAAIHDKDATPMLVEVVLKESDADLRDIAVQVLADWKDRRAVPQLEQALRSETDDIRGHAAAALGTMGDTSCVPALIGALEDFNPVVRGAAALSIARLGDVSSATLIRKKAETESDALARATMSWGIGLLTAVSGGPDRDWAIGELEKILLDPADSDFARAQCAKALGELNSCRSRPTLTRAMNDRKGMVKKAANNALTNLKC